MDHCIFDFLDLVTADLVNCLLLIPAFLLLFEVPIGDAHEPLDSLLLIRIIDTQKHFHDLNKWFDIALTRGVQTSQDKLGETTRHFIIVE